MPAKRRQELTLVAAVVVVVVVVVALVAVGSVALGLRRRHR